MSDLIKIFSNIKICRNVKKYPFVKLMTQEQKNSLLLDLVGCLQNAGYKCARLPFDMLKINQAYFCILYDLPINEKAVILHIAAGKQLESDVYAIVGYEEHITLVSCLTRGQDIQKNYEQICAIEQAIDQQMPYAATVKHGYMCANLKMAGLGLSLSSTIHAAGILQTEDKSFFSKMNERGYEITNMCSTAEGESSFIKITSNRQYGISEEDLIRQFSEGIEQFIEIDNRQLLKYYNKNKQHFDDTILKSFGILKFNKSIMMDEALIKLGDVITGLRVNLLSYVSQEASAETVGDLLLRIFDQDVIGQECRSYEDIQSARASVIKEYLKEIKETEAINDQ